MILPNKHITADFSLIGISSKLLPLLDEQKSVSVLWEDTKDLKGVGTFERFSFALSLLFAMGIVEYSDGQLKKAKKQQ